MFLCKSHISEKTVLIQSDCKIFKSAMFPEQINEIAWFLLCWYEWKSWLKFFGGHSHKWVWLLWSRDSKTACVYRFLHLEKVRTVSTAVILGSALSKMDVTFWFMKCWNLLYRKSEFMNWTGFCFLIVVNKVKGRISKWVFQEKKPRHIFRKTNISYPLIHTRTCAYQGVRNVRFSENLAGFVFLKHPFWDSPFFLITDDID